MNRVLVVFSDGLLSELDSARGLVSRSAWIRQAVEDKMMKEAAAPLVPAWKPSDIVYDAEVEMMPKVLVSAITFKPQPKARRKKSVKDSPALTGSREVEADSGLIGRPPESPSLLPARCNRGACTGTIKPNGHCMICNQRPRIQDW